MKTLRDWPDAHADFSRRVRRFWLGIGAAIVATALALVVPSGGASMAMVVPQGFDALAVVLPAAAALALYLTLRLIAFPCPHCRRTFTGILLSGLPPFGSRCAHCGLALH
jgi:hypothetical protein